MTENDQTTRGSLTPGSKENAGALIIGGDYRGLGIVRSLGRQGIPVWVLTDEHLLAATSRYARRSLPWPAGDDTQRVKYLLELGVQHGLDGWALFPTGDEAVGLLACNHAELKKQFRLTIPPWEEIRWAYDKRLTYALAQELGVDFPRTYYPESSEAV